MKLIKLGLVLAVVATVLSVYSPPAAFANHTPQHTVCEQVKQVDAACESGEDRIFGANGVVARGFGILTFLAGTAAVLIIIIAGLMYIFSGGDPQNTARAKDAILYAVVGLVVIVVSRLVVQFILGRL